MISEIASYHATLPENEREICQLLMYIIEQHLHEASAKVWHGSPVWFIDGNPIVGYSRQKNHVQLLFWSGQSFEDADLSPVGKHKAAEAVFTDLSQIDPARLAVWLERSEQIQWDYKNIVKRNGVLLRLK